MKKVFSVLVILFIAFGTFGSESIGFSFDAAFAQDFLYKEDCMQFNMDFRALVTEDFQFRLPFTVSLSQDLVFLDLGLFLVYYPWRSGPFFGMSLVQMGMVSGDSSIEDRFSGLNEVVIGWTFEFGPGLFVEPSMLIRDPSGTFSDEYAAIRGDFPSYRTIRGRLALGWNFYRR